MNKKDIYDGMELRIMKKGYNHQLGRVVQISRTTDNVRLRVSSEPEICCWIMPCDLQPAHYPYLTLEETVPAVPPVKVWYVMRRGGDTPTKMHASYNAALVEARRLAEAHQTGKFDILAVHATAEYKCKYVYEVEVS